MIPYSRHLITEDDIRAVTDVLRSDWLTTGPAVERFEASLAEYVGAKHAVAVSSGTAALHLCFMSQFQHTQRYDLAGILTSPFSFVATANAAASISGCEVLVEFLDVEEATGNMRLPEFYDAERFRFQPDVLVPVHYSGRACVLPQHPRNRRGADWVAEADIPIIEDACHALGAMDYDGCSRVGSCAHSLATCFSFHPVKPITTGEGGAITTNDEGLAKELRSLRNHGRDENGLMVRLGGNYRMSDIQAALGLSQLKRCDEMRERRYDLGQFYAEAFYGNRLAHFDIEPEGAIVLPVAGAYADRNAWHLYPVRIKGGKRDAVKRYLNERGIGAQVHYSPIIPMHPYYRERFHYREGSFPNAEAWAAETLSLPLHAGMTEKDVESVVETLKEALNV